MKNATKTQKKKAPATSHDHGHEHGHSHGEGGCCGHDHGLVCELHLRLVHPQDLKELRAAWKGSGHTLDDRDTDKSLARCLDQHRNFFRVFVAEAQMVETSQNEKVGKPRIAGGIIAAFDGRSATFYRLGVHPDFRGIGLAAALLETAEKQGKLWGASHMRLENSAADSDEDLQKVLATAGWKSATVCWEKTQKAR
ncbi:MAG TPA: GNAT family N-acetyltransferase [Planctomycetota bacterium]|nr:GNAT family N-acetyltransferase [Planctomycetota bacterium]